MRVKQLFLIILAFILVQVPVFSQTHNAVPLSDPIYHIIETAQMRGFIGFLPNVRPFSRSQILEIIDEILGNEREGRGALTEAERTILEQHKIRLNPPRGGLDLVRGTISGENELRNIYFSYEFGFGLDFVFSNAYYPIAGGYQYNSSEDPDGYFHGANHVTPGSFYTALDIGAPFLSFTGDLGRNHSYGLTLIGRIVQNPRVTLGRGHNDFDTYDPALPRQITIFSEPVAYFPYSYKKRWDGFVWPTTRVSSGSMLAWPYDLGIGYTMFPELSGAFLNGAVNYRIARLDREWTGMAAGSSLILNEAAQPFLAMELTIAPFNWFSISSLTGVMEYHNAIGYNGNNPEMYETIAGTQQNAFSIVMLELNYKNYFHIDFGTTVIWPKRFELGYIFPFSENLLYQNNIGSFDNMGLFFNIQGQYPGLGKIWFSLFLDEINIAESNMFAKDRSMYAFQIGTSVHIPWKRLPFTSLTFSYTKNEPYNYTHQREDRIPWYSGKFMEKNYVNNGRSLGHYIPPNADEFLLRLETRPMSYAAFSLQYQLIRHGADYGDRAVDGSHLWSELDPSDRSRLYKYFLRDGAYQWMHILKLRGEYSFTERKWPLKIFAEVGGVYSYFTDITGDVNSNLGPEPYRIINTPQYPHQLYFIATIGVTIFPK